LTTGVLIRGIAGFDSKSEGRELDKKVYLCYLIIGGIGKMAATTKGGERQDGQNG
jgi:hypothetical protein